jgi:hypothetical protein
MVPFIFVNNMLLIRQMWSILRIMGGNEEEKLGIQVF